MVGGDRGVGLVVKGEVVGVVGVVGVYTQWCKWAWEVEAKNSKIEPMWLES
jgi:hypothetical protein